VVRSRPEPFIVVFHDSHHRDILFAAGRVVDGPVELGLHPWDVDRFGGRELFPYHAKICFQGIPHHIWSREVASKLLSDEAIIIHIEEDITRKVDQRSFDCWVVCKDPSRIPQLVLLSVMQHDPMLNRDTQAHPIRPRGALNSNVFKVLLHIEAVEDLMFYHYPRVELVADGKTPWRDFHWQHGRLDEEDLHPPPIRSCDQEGRTPRGRSRDDDDNPDIMRHRARGFISHMYGYMDATGRSREINNHTQRYRGSGWTQGESSQGRGNRYRDGAPHVSYSERHAHPHVYHSERQESVNNLLYKEAINTEVGWPQPHETLYSEPQPRAMEAIVITRYEGHPL
jgi:hypothetical protein